MALITCEHLTLAYEGRGIVCELDFAVDRGDYLCIVGENGSGKSTLVRTLLGLHAPAEGSISFGEGLTAADIGFLPQHTAVQRDFPASVEEIVLSGCQNRFGRRPFYGKQARALAAAQMQRLGVTELAKRCFRELSGGQQQRVLLARALCATRDLLLLDEPTAGLDPHVTAELYTLISQLNAEGLTVIMVSHDIPAAVRDASHILHIAHQPQFFGTAADYAQSPIGRAYLQAGGAHI